MENSAKVLEALERMDIRRTISSSAPAAIGRFRDALKSANPHLNEDQLGAYVEHFSAQIPVLTEIILSEHNTSLSQALSEHELEVLCDFAGRPEIVTFLEVTRKNYSNMQAAIQKIMREDGVAVHRQSLEAAMSTL